MSYNDKLFKAAHLGACLAVLLFGPILQSYATVIMGEIDWNTPETSETFDHHPVATVVDYPATGGNPSTGGWMRIDFPAIASAPGRMWYDVISTPATNLFTGVWTNQMWLQFDFWQSNVVAGAVQFRWQSSTNSSVWRQAVTPPSALQTWTTLAASLKDWTLWQYPGANQAQYLSDLQTINWVGVYIFRNTTDEQIYGIDNFRLMIPEPAEIFLLAAVIAAGLFSRRRRKEMYAG